MRLLHTTTLELKEFFVTGDDRTYGFYEDGSINVGGPEEKNIERCPKYAILSHTWGSDEVLFQDITGERSKFENKAGFSKIKYSCQTAALDGYDYIWIDTCCIDKSSSAELSEAINSMYEWYRSSDVCYAYMSDVYTTSDRSEEQDNFASSFSASRWFTRGWTLQELIAPKTVHFYNSEWIFLGTKENLTDLISTTTNIDACALDGVQDMSGFSVARRMVWASRRRTTRLEDIAYCLLGIFGINMPLLYGEKGNAFIRLQHEIMKITNDQSLFAWGLTAADMGVSSPLLFGEGPLATSPASFRFSSVIAQFCSFKPSLPLALPAEGGVCVKVLLREGNLMEDHKTSAVAILQCDIGNVPGVLTGIKLSRCRDKESVEIPEFVRSSDAKVLMFSRCTSNNEFSTEGFDPNEAQTHLTHIDQEHKSTYENWKPTTIIIKSCEGGSLPLWPRFRFACPILIPDTWLEIIDVYPPRFWDSHNGALCPYTYGYVDCSDPVLVWLHFQGHYCTLVLSLWHLYGDSHPDTVCTMSWFKDIKGVKRQMTEIQKSFSVAGKPHRERRYERQKAFSDFLGTKWGADDIGCELLEIQKDFSGTQVIRLFLRDHEADMQLDDEDTMQAEWLSSRGYVSADEM
ncbi:hypothetical protein GLAREA_07854 [Glarea lozoyensis ATCC 20868]|uniref:Uncharacterized protein n=1 Tax=Glarea lozoyensis (strain ATCC 20868 / MF5171) TaxID=1116229 RepID=S3D4J9_GLAL2|nr:uncharacterized protein GLAREA_07854 [Glarea lozoyensis ATCC 20868]EPE32720.1 hypothetical protein GLAREA_07854 [Glarea lozoyensis ATCC 20868]